ncbi:MAG: hypothetical protein OEU36_23745 [Gammaproteobacteria bacterium]|nr:hypothetical protein [Gammaproteobacteria bacterium]
MNQTQDKRLAKKLKSIRDQFQCSLDELDSLIKRTAGNTVPAEISRRFRLLELVGEYTNGVPKAEFHAISSKVGYSNNRVAGFFKGKNASLIYIPTNGEDKVFLTKRGHNLVEEATYS